MNLVLTELTTVKRERNELIEAEGEATYCHPVLKIIFKALLVSLEGRRMKERGSKKKERELDKR